MNDHYVTSHNGSILVLIKDVDDLDNGPAGQAHQWLGEHGIGFGGMAQLDGESYLAYTINPTAEFWVLDTMKTLMGEPGEFRWKLEGV